MLRKWLLPIEDISPWRFYLRLAWVAVQLVVTHYFLSSDDPFFYQGF
jgi:hypothetical protein